MNCANRHTSRNDRRWRSRLKRLRAALPTSLAASALILGAACWLQAGEAEVPVVKGDVGPCTVDFVVTDPADKPLYNAKIHVIVRYGFLSKRKLELEVGTNSNGKARFEGLPNKTKRPLEFRVRFGEQRKSVWHDPSENCTASFNVQPEAE